MPGIPASPQPKPSLSKVSDLLGQRQMTALAPQAGRLSAPGDLFAPSPALARESSALPTRPMLSLPPQSQPAVQETVRPGTPVGPGPKAARVAAPVSGQTLGVAKGTGYYPHNSKLEGGYNDMRGKPLRTLQDFLAGKAEYVSIALDEDLYAHIIEARRAKYLKTKDPALKKYLTLEPKIKYGDTFRIPELEQKYGRQIVFKAVDTGGAFKNKGFSRVDIATGGYRHSLDKTVNGKLTLVRQ